MIFGINFWFLPLPLPFPLPLPVHDEKDYDEDDEQHDDFYFSGCKISATHSVACEYSVRVATWTLHAEERRGFGKHHLEAHLGPGRPPQLSTSVDTRYLRRLDLVAENPLESFSDGLWWSGFENLPVGQAEAEQVLKAARPREDHIVGQPQCFR